MTMRKDNKQKIKQEKKTTVKTGTKSGQNKSPVDNDAKQSRAKKMLQHLKFSAVSMKPIKETVDISGGDLIAHDVSLREKHALHFRCQKFEQFVLKTRRSANNQIGFEFQWNDFNDRCYVYQKDIVENKNHMHHTSKNDSQLFYADFTLSGTSYRTDKTLGMLIIFKMIALSKKGEVYIRLGPDELRIKAIQIFMQHLDQFHHLPLNELCWINYAPESIQTIQRLKQQYDQLLSNITFNDK